MRKNKGCKYTTYYIVEQENRDYAWLIKTGNFKYGNSPRDFTVLAFRNRITKVWRSGWGGYSSLTAGYDNIKALRNAPPPDSFFLRRITKAEALAELI